MLQQSVSKYKVKVKEGDKEFEEEIEIDTKEQTETYRIPKTNSGNAGEVDVVYDFKKVKYFGQVKVGVKFQWFWLKVFPTRLIIRIIACVLSRSANYLSISVL